MSIETQPEKFDENAPEVQKLYMPWHNNKQFSFCISRNVHYVGGFSGFGSLWPQSKLLYWKRARTALAARGQGLFLDQNYQEKALNATLQSLKDCVVFSTTATYYSQFQSACLLQKLGFELLANKCYKHPGYKNLSGQNPEHPGIPDRYEHWEHIWWKVLGKPLKIGQVQPGNWMHNCGVDTVESLAGLKIHEAFDRRNYLTVGWLEVDQKTPAGWRTFFEAQDYKLVHNFENIGGAGRGTVVDCPHKFDLAIFKDWQPDFDFWRPK